jgi:hypothetical protein
MAPIGAPATPNSRGNGMVRMHRDVARARVGVQGAVEEATLEVHVKLRLSNLEGVEPCIDGRCCPPPRAAPPATPRKGPRTAAN